MRPSDMTRAVLIALLLTVVGSGVLSSPASAQGDSCSNGQYVRDGYQWLLRSYPYVANEGRLGQQARGAVTAGHHSFDDTINNCGYNDANNFRSDYIGDCSALGASCLYHTTRDNKSVVDQGNMASVGCAGAIACTLTFVGGGGNADETDQRYDETLRWWDETTTGAPNSTYYDRWAVAAH